MIYPHLPSLKLTEEFIHDLKKFPYKYYVKRKRAKMKFGKKQLNKKGEVKYRITYEPINSLKEKQRGIHEILSQIKLPDSLFGGVKGRNNISNAFQHIESTHFLTIDLRDFFTNVKDVMINEALHLYGYSYN